MVDFENLEAAEMTPAEVEETEAQGAIILRQDMSIRHLAEFSGRVDQMVLMSKAMTVRNEEEEVRAVTLGGEAKKIFKAIEERRKQIIQEPEAFTKAVNGFAKGFTERLKNVEDDLKGKISQYAAAVEAERRRQEQAAEMARQELQRKLDAEAAEANKKAQEEAKKAGADPAGVPLFKAPEVPAPIVPARKRSTRTETGTSSYQAKAWTFKLIDINQVPREFMALDEKRVRDHIKSGTRFIPGIEIYEETTTKFRT